MARYKAIDTSPRFLAVDLEKQLLPGSFEYAVHHLLDHEFDLSLFDVRNHNDQNGDPALEGGGGNSHNSAKPTSSFCPTFGGNVPLTCRSGFGFLRELTHPTQSL